MAIDLAKLEDSDYLLDVMIQIEDLLDSLDLWVFKSWYDGEVSDGPVVRRHWVSISLLYPYNKMPDPRAALRLLKHGVQVEFNKIKQAETNSQTGESEEPEKPTHWLVKLTLPRRLLSQSDEANLEIYDDEVDSDDVTAAKDTGLDNESRYQSDEQAPKDGNPLDAETPPMPPQPPQQQGGAPNAPF